MLLGMAESLAAELNVYNTLARRVGLPATSNTRIGRELEQRYNNRRTRIRLLLFVHATQSSTKSGSQLFQNQGFVDADISRVQELSQETQRQEKGWLEPEWLTALAAWAKLSKLAQDARRLLFQSPEHSVTLILTGQHLILLKHFQTLMQKWSEDMELLNCTSTMTPNLPSCH